jgi:hypothetical protein
MKDGPAIDTPHKPTKHAHIPRLKKAVDKHKPQISTYCFLVFRSLVFGFLKRARQALSGSSTGRGDVRNGHGSDIYTGEIKRTNKEDAGRTEPWSTLEGSRSRRRTKGVRRRRRGRRQEEEARAPLCSRWRPCNQAMTGVTAAAVVVDGARE